MTFTDRSTAGLGYYVRYSVSRCWCNFELCRFIKRLSVMTWAIQQGRAILYWRPILWASSIALLIAHWSVQF